MVGTEGNEAPPPQDGAVRLVTLGGAVLLRPDGSVLMGASKPLALLTYLHCLPGRAAGREHLANLLWGDSPPARALGALRTNLHRVRVALGESALDAAGSEVRLVAVLACDRDLFLSAVERGDLEAAVRAYAGPFFPDYGDPGAADFEQWTEGERARLQELFVRSSESLARRRLAEGRASDAVVLARRIRELAPEVEIGWQLLLEGLLGARDDLAARAEGEALQAWLRQHDVEARPATRRLLRLVREGGAAPEEGREASRLVAELIGREREFSAIMQAWQVARGGTAQSVHLSAPAGLGKSRLLTDVANRLRIVGAHVVSVRADPGVRHIPHLVAGELARALGGCRGAAGVSLAAARVLVALQPALTATYPRIEPTYLREDQRYLQATALRELVEAIADEAPLAILVDDTHWLDPASRDILTALATSIEGGRVFFVSAGRPSPAGGGLSSRSTALDLAPLDAQGTEAMLASIGSCPDAEWSRRVASAVHRAARGSPLLILETLQLARDLGELTLDHGAWSAPDIARLEQRLSASDAMDARLSRLGSSERTVLLLMALAGTPIDEVTLATLLRATGESRVATMDALERLGYVARTVEGWQLVHETLGDAVRRGAKESQLRTCHAALGAELAARTPATEVTLQRAATHLAEAGEIAQVRALFPSYLQRVRALGDRSPVTSVVWRFASPFSALVSDHSLVASLPFATRWGATRARMAVATIALLVTALGARRLAQTAAARPADAWLVIAAGDTMPGAHDVVRIPVSPEGWTPGDTIKRNEGDVVGRWQTASGLFDPGAMSPDGKRFAFARVTGDSGVIDVFLRRSDGSSVRLTNSPGDDLAPTWSPDGARLAFSTSRFSAGHSGDLDVAILDLRTLQVQPVTRGPDSDRLPFWSPDGTRIAFLRVSANDGGLLVCWASVDGTRSKCRPADGALLGWRDASTVLVATARGASAVALATGDVTPLDLAGQQPGIVSRDGQWVVGVSRAANGDSGALVVFPLAQPLRARPIAGSLSHSPARIAWEGGRELQWIAALHIAPTGSPVVGVAHHLHVVGSDAAGGAVSVAPEVVRWSSTDTTIASVDATTGVLTPRRTGRVVIHADAGGWRDDSTTVTIGAPSFREAWRETWSDSSMPGWRRFGTPVPRVVRGPGGERAFWNAGDETFESGALSEREVDAREGVTLQARISLPITRPTWQQLKLAITADASLGPDRIVTNPRAPLCRVEIPAAEGEKWMTYGTFVGNRDSIILPDVIATGDSTWHDLRVQLYPDGTCGFAMDGREVWRSTAPMEVGGKVRLAVIGKSVGGRVLVGGVGVGVGVR